MSETIEIKMGCLQKVAILHVIFQLFCLSVAQNDTFDEELMIKPLPNGFVYAYFQFTTLWEAQNNVNTCKLPMISTLIISNQ